MFKFQWKDIVNQTLVDHLKGLAAEDELGFEEIAAPLTVIFKSTGGMPLAESEWDAAHINQVAKKLLHEAVQRLLRKRYYYQHQEGGVLSRKEGGAIVQEAAPRVDINHASEAEIEALPVIGPAIAKRIIAVRRSNGPFSSLDDLANKVSGLGSENVQHLAGLLRFGADGRPSSPALGYTLNHDLKALLQLSSERNQAGRLINALEELAVFTIAEPHPANRYGLKRSDLEPAFFSSNTTANLETETLSVLADQDYYEILPGLLKDATTSITVCLFFMGLGDEKHPTRALLDTLIQKASDGLDVKVLVDRDAEDDPYGSRLINARAARYLTENGVQVKTDQTDRLLHSKFVLIDEDTTIIGSHNWTTGSYFLYKDISFLVKGAAVKSFWSTRFDELWSTGELVEVEED